MAAKSWLTFGRLVFKIAMSRIGNAPISIPIGVAVAVQGNIVTVNGPKGTLELSAREEVNVSVENDKVVVRRIDDARLTRSLHGLTRSLINNAIIGVSVGWMKRLEMVGVGYRAQSSGDKVTLSVGFSHPVVVTAPLGVTLAVSENTKIAVSGIDKTLVGQIASNIRAIKPPEVYKGKGIRYAGERVRRKAGKAGKAPGASK